MNKNFFYTVMLEVNEADDQSFFQVFWAWADNIGEAIYLAQKEARLHGINESYARAIDPYDYDTLPEHVQEGKTPGTLYTEGRTYYDYEETITLPTGVIESCVEGDVFIEDVKEGFDCYTSSDETLCVDVTLDEKNLERIFLELVAELPSIRVTWVEISHEWETRTEQVFWSNEGCNYLESIMYLLKNKELGILKNGLLKLTVYSEEGATNVILTDHKTVSVLTKTTEIQNLMRDKLLKLGLHEFDSVKSIEYGMHHWHYIPYKASKREEFEKSLQMNGFEIWRTLEVNA